MQRPPCAYLCACLCRRAESTSTGGLGRSGCRCSGHRQLPLRGALAVVVKVYAPFRCRVLRPPVGQPAAAQRVRGRALCSLPASAQVCSVELDELPDGLRGTARGVGMHGRCCSDHHLERIGGMEGKCYSGCIAQQLRRWVQQCEGRSDRRQRSSRFWSSAARCRLWNA
eukprot:6474570-Prymnesium_polylepis.1